MKKVVALLAVVACVAAAGMAVVQARGGQHYLGAGAIVGNFGVGQGGRFGCSANCGAPYNPCVINGKLAFRQTPSGVGGLSCNDGEFLFPGLFGEGLIPIGVGCGVLGSGQGVITPSQQVNYYCNTN